MDHRHTPTIALMWRGDPAQPSAPTHYETRLHPVFEALRARGLAPSPIVFFEEDAAAIHERLKSFDAILVWINPLAGGRDRSAVDGMLRELANRGAWVSTHPDTIEKMGTKAVLHATRALGWGSDTALHASIDALRASLTQTLPAGARVLKPLRGNDGQGVLKVASAGALLSVQHAHDNRVEAMTWETLADRLAPLFAAGGGIIDQEFHPNVAAGMVRCYMSFDRVIGFAQQAPRLRDDNAPAFAMNAAKTMHGSDYTPLADLRALMEAEWTPGLMRLLNIEKRDLPVLWDADFLTRQPGKNALGSRHVLCEINVSCVSPFPDTAPAAVAAACAWRLGLSRAHQT